MVARHILHHLIYIQTLCLIRSELGDQESVVPFLTGALILQRYKSVSLQAERQIKRFSNRGKRKASLIQCNVGFGRNAYPEIY